MPATAPALYCLTAGKEGGIQPAKKRLSCRICVQTRFTTEPQVCLCWPGMAWGHRSGTYMLRCSRHMQSPQNVFPSLRFSSCHALCSDPPTSGVQPWLIQATTTSILIRSSSDSCAELRNEGVSSPQGYSSSSINRDSI